MRWAARLGVALVAFTCAIAAAPFLLIAALLPTVGTSACPASSTEVTAPADTAGGREGARPGMGCSSTGELVLPLPPGYRISDAYGWRNLGMGTNPFHRGVDLVAPCGTPVFAMMSGTVISTDRLTILIETPGIARIGYLHTKYSDHLVRAGNLVSAGQQLSAVGSEPPSTGCHLDVRVDIRGAIDPRVEELTADPGAGPKWVNPEEFARIFGVELRQ